MSPVAARAPLFRARAAPNPRSSWWITRTCNGVGWSSSSGGSEPSSTTTTSKSSRG